MRDATQLQGDVIAILDDSGNVVVQYMYDAWGKLLTTTGSMADSLGLHNPLRYRGYVYDSETGLYYLQSRYYDPEIGRFINADAFTSTGQGLLGNNMFAYCLNNPVQHEDQQGTFVNTVTGAIVGGIIGAINAYIEGEDVTAGALIGATTGALAGAAADFAIATGGLGAVAIAAVGGAAASSISYLGNKVANNGEIRGDELLLEATVGAAANLLTFGVGDGKLIKAGGKAISNMANNFTTTMMKNTTKTVAGKTVYKSVKTVVKHVAKNFMTATAETAAISGGAWLNSKAWGVLIQ